MVAIRSLINDPRDFDALNREQDSLLHKRHAVSANGHSTATPPLAIGPLNG